MLLPRETLTPVNIAAVGVLPPSNIKASDQPAQLEVRRVFPNAVEISDQLSFMRGYFALFGATGTIGLGYGLTTLPSIIARADSLPIFSIAVELLVGLPCFLLSYFLFRADTTGLRYEPVLFNRGSPGGGTVHQLAAASVSLIPFKPVKTVIHDYAWNCVRAEVTSQIVGAAPFTGRQYFLTLAIVDSPGSNRVVDRFNVGLMDTGDGSRAIALWEHLRRYMQEGGPALGANGIEGVIPAEPLALWWCLLSFMPFGPDSSMYGGMAWWAKILATAVMVIVLPFTMTFGFFRWLSLLLKKTPKWPAEILASAGGAALSRNELARTSGRAAVV